MDIIDLNEIDEKLQNLSPREKCALCGLMVAIGGTLGIYCAMIAAMPYEQSMLVLAFIIGFSALFLASAARRYAKIGVNVIMNGIFTLAIASALFEQSHRTPEVSGEYRVVTAILLALLALGTNYFWRHTQ